MNFWVIIGIVIVIILFTGISVKKILYKQQSRLCPKIADMDISGKNKFKLLMERILNFKELWFSIIFKTPKKWILFITLLLLLIGYLIDILNRVEFLRNILSFYGTFMSMLSIFFTGVTYIFAMIVGLFIYGDVNYLIHNNCSLGDKVANIFLTFLNYLLCYILPLIIIVSLISSSANTINNEGSDDCPSISGNQINPDIMNVLFIIVSLLIVASYIIFSHLKCSEITLLNQGNSFLYTLLILFFIIIGNVYLVYITIQNYTNTLTKLYEGSPNWSYWLLLVVSILIYLILTYRGLDSKNLMEKLFDRFLKGFFDRCNNTNNGNKEEMPPSINKPSINKPSININKPSINIKINPKTKLYV